jgi:hypothetical protein
MNSFDRFHYGFGFGIGFMLLVATALIHPQRHDKEKVPCPVVEDTVNCIPKLSRNHLVGDELELSIPEGCTFAKRVGPVITNWCYDDASGNTEVKRWPQRADGVCYQEDKPK